MPETTEKLQLFKYDTVADAKQKFNIKKALNENFDKIDNAISGMDDTLTDLQEKKIRAVTNGIYEPVDLTVKHADEIAEEHGGNAWAWIQSRIRAVNFKGINVEDYIPIKLTGGTIGGEFVVPQNLALNMQVGGIDTYYNYGDTPIPHHIDFVASHTLGATTTWNDGNTNNGTAAQPNPYLSSKVYAILNGVNNYTTSAQGSLKHGLNCSSGGVLQMLPKECQDVLITKRNWMEQQYSASAQTVQPTGHSWVDMGKVFPFHEVEVCAYQPNSYNRGEAGNIDNLTRNMTRQYPIFAQSTRIRCNAQTGARQPYWLCCPSGNSATIVCDVNSGGTMYQGHATTTDISLCFGFRVA